MLKRHFTFVSVYILTAIFFLFALIVAVVLPLICLVIFIVFVDVVVDNFY